MDMFYLCRYMKMSQTSKYHPLFCIHQTRDEKSATLVGKLGICSRDVLAFHRFSIFQYRRRIQAGRTHQGNALEILTCYKTPCASILLKIFDSTAIPLAWLFAFQLLTGRICSELIIFASFLILSVTEVLIDVLRFTLQYLS